jgi:pimeloyl-ACP methyl ester carboxylesterase
MQETTVPSDGVALHVLDRGGRGQPVVLLHGGGRDLHDWDDVGALLAALGHRVVAVDLRGHGRTPRAPWTWELALRDVSAVVRALGLERPAVVGHSLGGMVAALWAAGHPECPLAVNLDGHGNPTRPDQYAALDPDDGARAHERVQEVLAVMRAGLDEQMTEVMAAIDELDLPQVYRAARCPLLVTRGRQSMAGLLPGDAQEGWRGYEAWVRDQLAAAAAATPLLDVEWTDTAHDVHLEAPETVTQLVDRRLTPAR